jgi:Uma2 family endonuclease
MEFALSSLPLPVRLRPETPMSDDDFMRFSAENHSLRMEREPNGEILVMTPTNNKTGKMNLRIGRLLDVWTEEDGRGVAFDSSTGFKLPNGAVRSPDGAWIASQRWDRLTEEEQEGFGMAPDFIIELRSPTDSLPAARAKMEEWMANGVTLGWLIDPKRKVVEVYRPGEEPEIHENPTSVQGDGPVRGFELVMGRVWG